MAAKDLREKRAKLLTDARAISTRAEQEKRELTAEEVASQRKMLDDARIAGDELRNMEDLEREERNPSFPESQREKTPEEQDAAEKRAADLREFIMAACEGRGPRSRSFEATKEQRQLIALPGADFRALMRGERRTMNTLALASGGAAVAPDTSMYGRVIEALKFYGGIEEFGATPLVTATGADLPIATDDDTSNTGAIVAEEGSHTGGTDVTMGQKVLKAFLYSSKIIKFSLQLVQDASFNIEGYLGGKIGTRIGRILNTHQTTGLGVNQPQGIVTAATVGRQFATGFSTTVSFDELKRTKHSVDKAYRNGAKWMFNDTTALLISLIKDGNGRYLLQDSVNSADEMMLLGHPVVINNDMADMAASAKPIIFGQGAAYYSRKVSGLRIVVLNELYAENGQIGILGFMRADGGLIDAGQGPVKVGQNSAS